MAKTKQRGLRRRVQKTTEPDVEPVPSPADEDFAYNRHWHRKLWTEAERLGPAVLFLIAFILYIIALNLREVPDETFRHVMISMGVMFLVSVVASIVVVDVIFPMMMK